jgi:hypothetical protein
MLNYDYKNGARNMGFHSDTDNDLLVANPAYSKQLPSIKATSNNAHNSSQLSTDNVYNVSYNTSNFVG